MVEQRGWTRRVETYRASKTQVFWACAACVVVTLVVGFGWGGWVTGASARHTTTKAVADARADMAAAFCVQKFGLAPDAGAKLAALKNVETWKRGEFIEKGGWVAVPGTDSGVTGAADLCAQQLMEAKAPEKSAGNSG